MQMRHFFIILMLILPVAKSYSQTPKVNCENPITQADMNNCAALDFKKADQELNSIYQEVISKLSPETKHLLVAAQKSWISVRDNHCAVYTKLYDRGSMMPLMVNTCKTELTRNRIKELRTLLKELEN